MFSCQFLCIKKKKKHEIFVMQLNVKEIFIMYNLMNEESNR